MTDAEKPDKPETARPSAKAQLRVGRLVKAHGLKGAIKLELYTDDPDGRFVPGATFTLQVPESSPWHGKPLTVREFRWMNSHPVAFFEGVDDRDAAEELIRAILWIDQDAATAAPEDNAWYDHQLVGLEVVRDDVVVGRVIRVEHFPSQDLLVVRPSTGRAGPRHRGARALRRRHRARGRHRGRPRGRDSAARPLRGASGRR